MRRFPFRLRACRLRPPDGLPVRGGEARRNAIVESTPGFLRSDLTRQGCFRMSARCLLASRPLQTPFSFETTGILFPNPNARGRNSSILSSRTMGRRAGISPLRAPRPGVCCYVSRFPLPKLDRSNDILGLVPQVLRASAAQDNVQVERLQTQLDELVWLAFGPGFHRFWTSGLLSACGAGNSNRNPAIRS